MALLSFFFYVTIYSEKKKVVIEANILRVKSVLLYWIRVQKAPFFRPNPSDKQPACRLDSLGHKTFIHFLS